MVAAFWSTLLRNFVSVWDHEYIGLCQESFYDECLSAEHIYILREKHNQIFLNLIIYNDTWQNDPAFSFQIKSNNPSFSLGKRLCQSSNC